MEFDMIGGNKETTLMGVTAGNPMGEVKLAWEIEDLEQRISVAPRPFCLYSGVRIVKSVGEYFYWWFQLKVTEKNDVEVSLSLEQDCFDSQDEIVRCKYKITMGDQGMERISMPEFCVYPRGYQSKEALRVPLQELLEKKERILHHGILRIEALLKLWKGHQVETWGNFPPLVEPVVVRDSYKASFCNKKLLSVVTIHCYGEVFHVDRTVLGGNKVLAEKFARTNEIFINQVFPEPLEILLKSLHGLDFQIPGYYGNGAELRELLFCANYFKHHSLKVSCFDKMASILTDQNAGKLYSLALQYTDDEEILKIFRNACLKKCERLLKDREFAEKVVDSLNAFE